MATTAALAVGQQVATGALFRQAERPSNAAGADTTVCRTFTSISWSRISYLAFLVVLELDKGSRVIP